MHFLLHMSIIFSIKHALPHTTPTDVMSLLLNVLSTLYNKENWRHSSSLSFPPFLLSHSTHFLAASFTNTKNYLLLFHCFCLEIFHHLMDIYSMNLVIKSPFKSSHFFILRLTILATNPNTHTAPRISSHCYKHPIRKYIKKHSGNTFLLILLTIP